MTIIFGTKRLGKEDGANGTVQKYPNQAVVTLEGVRGANKSRRFLFNAKAAEALGLEKGLVQQMIFGTFVNENQKSVLIANANNIVELEGLTLYKTSKNPVSFDDSKEKGKAVSSSVITGDITTFLGLDDEVNHEFTLEDLNSDQIEAMRLVPIANSIEVEAEVLNVGPDELTANEPLDTDPFAAITETPEAPKVEGVNWDEDKQDSQVDAGLTRATAE